MKFHCSISYRKDEIVPPIGDTSIKHEARGAVESSSCLAALDMFIAENVPAGYVVISVHAFAPSA